ncbi:glycerophosphodiester phosphodiesterase [Aliamphritea ceti]|uniref:glycerophosphodiester phosphodiesterase n=1 Tax=Aliamphritea ceti TaxID=1524258 RepID=UPI0021C447D2|nr:glycerophosphodiester phosphodiesterase [Aliamphritea ceti]
MLCYRIASFILSLILSQSLFASPVVIAHRGASGYLPEHTLEAVTLAIAQGADYIEQDLVLSKDLVPVVLHDIHLDRVTDVALKYPERKRQDGRFYTFDFTLAELKTLKVHERTRENGSKVFANRYQGNADFSIATFEDQIELVTELNRQRAENIGFYPEIKAPAWHKSQGADISKIVLDILRKHHLDDADKPVYIQCFDFSETQRLRNDLGAKVKLVQLIGENSWEISDTDYSYLQTPSGLSEIVKVAQGIGPSISHLIDIESKQITDLSSKAKKAGLAIHPYTLRVDALPKGFSNSTLLDMLFRQVKIEGLFTDFPDVVVGYLKQ